MFYGWRKNQTYSPPAGFRLTAQASCRARRNRTGRPCFIALYNEASVEIYKDGRLVYYVCAAEDGNLVEMVDGQFVYTTETTDPVRDETTGVTTRRTTVRGTDTALELLTANDAFGRKQQTGTLLRDLSGTQEAPEFAAILADYTYKTVGDGETPAATGQVDTLESRVTYGTTMQGENTVARYGFAYDYDANGNITHEYAVAENGTRTLRYRYTYDEANQLTRVDDNTQGRTHVYEYDRGGNRVSEKLYAYTLGAVGGDPQEEIVSYYGPRLDSVEGLFRGWYDVLRTYDGKGIQYDRSGNPVSYDGKTFTWNGKQLTKITAADGSCTEFAYDANGIRTQKRQFAPDGTLEYFVDYVWQDGLLTHQNMTYFLRVTVNGETRVAEVPFSAKILYDENDMPVGSMVSDEGAVGYVRNLQGDIVALVSPEGEVLVEYSYDPWGNVTVSHDGEAVEGLEAAIVAVFCPFAYRGYNYDFTTGLYYLQSRYYNPEWGRFLNVDDTNILLASQGESLGANLFAYCGNNPILMKDPSGTYATSIKSPLYSEMAVTLGILMLAFNNPIDITLDKNARKGIIQFHLDRKSSTIDGSLSDIVFSTYQEFETRYSKTVAENVYYVLALFCTDVFYENFAAIYNRQFPDDCISKRQFLFSDDCVADEIRAHCEGYWFALGKIRPTVYSTILYAGVSFQKRELEERCACIDIAEQDAASGFFDDRTVFRYFSGIRDCYKYTNADPYWQGWYIRTYQNVREDWKTQKISM